MATIANILTLIQQNHPKARMNLRTLLDIAVEIKKVTKHNIEEEGTPSFYVTQRGGEDAVNVIVESLGVESSMIHIEAAFVFESRLRANLLGSFNTRLIAKETCMTLKPRTSTQDKFANGSISRVLEAIKQLEAKDIMATIANILTLIQQNHPKARINLRTLLDIAVEIKKVTKHNIEEEGTPPFYVTRREAQIDSFIDTSALDESKAYQTTAATCFIHNTRYLDQIKILVDNLSDLKESLGVESSMIHIEAAFVFESRLRANLFC
ncbi:hypothetical protein ISN45_At03g035440 [Arabidopsis thaliana x Arabidopsis arenosa]|uniref:DUF7625 domain-containing protein n=1 Tax=Arabidopsis thaliana x Arabidopsis arenosa TaxID=1240361 RepID=A0A8T2F066_9BRAS|nr:hypothetical protein ISN45_At03g035440 [Arabidopsis thaliana x Arabidopsis arenosa]